MSGAVAWVRSPDRRRSAMTALGIHPSWEFADLSSDRQDEVARALLLLADAYKDGYQQAAADVRPICSRAGGCL